VTALILTLPLVVLFYWWFGGNGWLLTGYLGASLIAVVSVAVAYHLLGYAGMDDVRWLEEKEAEEYAELVDRLSDVKHELQDLDINEGVRQADVLTNIIDDYHSVVETRFIGKKHSPMAYLAAARTVQKHALQNLLDVVATGHSLSTIASNRRPVSEQDRQYQLQGEQQARVDTILAENRELFDALTETAVEVANMRTFSGFDRTDTLARLVGLAELASRTGK